MPQDNESHYEFYAPWPLLGKRFSAQLGEIRQNMENLHPIVRYSATYDKDPDGPKDSRLRGWEYGDIAKHNRFRTVSDVDLQWKLQANTGTEQLPFWHTVLAVNEDLSVTNFYIPSSIRVKATGNGPSINSDTIIFNRTNFYITSSSNGKPIINLIESEGGGTPLDVDDGFNEYLSIGNLSFSHTGFYLSRGSIGQPVVNSLNLGTGSSLGVDDGLNRYSSISQLSFSGTNFYLSRGSLGQPVVNFAGSAGGEGSGVALSFGPALEWVATHNLNQTPVLAQIFDTDYRLLQPHEQDVSNPNIAYFYFMENTSGYALLSAGGSGGGSSGGDHGALTGLADDDHTQYLLVNGSRHATGNFTFDANVSVTGISSLDGQVLANDGFSATGTSNFFGNVDVYGRVKADHFRGGGFYFDDGTGEAIPGIRVREIDGTPNVYPVKDLIVPNSSLTDNGKGVVTLLMSGGSNVTFTDGVRLFSDDTIHFNRTSFYLTNAKSSGDPVLNFKHPLTKTTQRGATWVKGGTLEVVASEAPLVQVYIPSACVITGVEILTNGGTGSCVVDIWKSPYSAFPPTVANSITGINKPTISGAIKYRDTTLSTWTGRSIAADSTLTFKLDAASAFTFISCTLTLEN